MNMKTDKTWYESTIDDSKSGGSIAISPLDINLLQTNSALFKSSASVAIKDQNNTLKKATNIGALNGTKQLKDFVGSTDPSDFYSFNLSANSNFNLALTGISKTAPNNLNVRLIRDANNNGKVEAGEIIASSTRGVGGEESINLSGLGAGKYYVQVEQASGSSNYVLSLSNSKPSNLLLDENNLGTLGNTAINRTGNISNKNTSDVYQFSLGANSNLNLSLTGISQTGTNNVDVRIVKDANNNGTIEAGEIIASSTQGAGKEELINLSGLGAGKYFVQVYQTGGTSNYKLNLSTSKPNNLLVTENNLGTLSNTVISATGNISNKNTADLYQVNIAANGFLNVVLSGISQTGSNDINLQLIKDANNNGIVDAGEIIASSTRGVGKEEIIKGLTPLPGKYFIQVYQSSGSSNYTLKVTNSNPNNLLVADTDLGAISNTPISTDNTINSLYKFTLGENSNFNLSFISKQIFIEDPQIPTAKLIYDANKNGILDAGEEIATAIYDVGKSGGIEGDGQINLSGLKAGTYFIQVNTEYNTGGYTLKLSSSNPSNLAPKPYILYPAVDKKTSGSISNNNTSQYYKFFWGAGPEPGFKLNLSLTGISPTANIDIRLFGDGNSNGIIEPGEIIASSTNGPGQNEFFNDLPTGEYSVQIYQVSGSSSYSLNLVTVYPDGSTNA